MSKLPGQAIREACPVAPMEERQRYMGLTYGIGPAGYDIRIAETRWMWPGRFVLASTIEYFQMPDDLLGTVHDKSTWIRCGVAMQNTVIEPGWRGHLTIEITKHGWKGRRRVANPGLWGWLLNHSPVFRLHAGMPIAQVLFDRLEAPAEQPYTGKYQDQSPGAQAAIFEPDDRMRRAIELLQDQPNSVLSLEVTTEEQGCVCPAEKGSVGWNSSFCHDDVCKWWIGGRAECPHPSACNERRVCMHPLEETAP